MTFVSTLVLTGDVLGSRRDTKISDLIQSGDSVEELKTTRTAVRISSLSRVWTMCVSRPCSCR